MKGNWKKTKNMAFINHTLLASKGRLSKNALLHSLFGIL